MITIIAIHCSEEIQQGWKIRIDKELSLCSGKFIVLYLFDKDC